MCTAKCWYLVFLAGLGFFCFFHSMFQLFFYSFVSLSPFCFVCVFFSFNLFLFSLSLSLSLFLKNLF